MKIINIYILLIVILLMSACSINNEIYEEIDINEETEEIDNKEPQIKTLTIRATNAYKSTLEIAANMLNADWKEKGYPYTFEIDFELHDIKKTQYFTSPEEVMKYKVSRENYIDRLRIEFMAGIAPDLILNELDLPIHQFSNYLMDFNTLIDNCPVTNHDDFFMNVLQAYEFFGGIYELPLHFSLIYVGINTYIPQHFIDRYKEFSYLRVSDFMRMYIEYLDEGGYMHHDLEEFVYVHNPILLNIRNFLDFNVRTADFNQPDFIKLMELSNEVLQRSKFGLSQSLGRSFFGGVPQPVDMMRDDAKYYLEKGDELTSFGCITYSHGLIDALRINHDLI